MVKTAIHTVFILKENILFLEQWIDYHLSIGFDHFYLYDNSRVQRGGGYHPRHKYFNPGKVNKYKVDYEKLVQMSQEQMDRHIQYLIHKYKCIDIIEWSPTDKDGIVLHNQDQAHGHCLKRLKEYKIDWCANIDMDEYIVTADIKNYISSLPNNISNIKIGQVRFESRFANMDKLVVEIQQADKEELPRSHSNKNIYKVSDTTNTTVHHWTGKNIQYLPPVSEIWFNHYKLSRSSDKFKSLTNISRTVLDKVKQNSESYESLKQYINSGN